MGYESKAEWDAIREHNRQVAQLGARLANLTERDDWPTELYGKPTCRQFIEYIDSLSGNERVELLEWEAKATACESVADESEIWSECPQQFVLSFLIEDDQTDDDDESDAMSADDVLEKACSVVANCIPWKSAEDELAAIENTLSMGSTSQREAVIQWANDVIATNESGTDLLANDAPLLRSIPEPLRDFFDLTSLDGKSTDESLSSKPEAMSFKTDRSGVKQQLEEELHQCRKRLDEAILEREIKDGEAKLAKKRAESAQDELNSVMRQLDDLNHGIYQARLPFHAESDTATASPQSAAKQGATPGNTDDVAGWHVSVLTTKELLQKTNGMSEGAGITDAIADVLGDAEFGTIGLLEAHMKKHGEFWFKSLKGIGEGKACKIAEALGCLRACYPVDTEPLDELVLDEAAYQQGVEGKRLGGPRACPYPKTGHQGRSWFKGYDDQANAEGGV